MARKYYSMLTCLTLLASIGRSLGDAFAEELHHRLPCTTGQTSSQPYDPTLPQHL